MNHRFALLPLLAGAAACGSDQPTPGEQQPEVVYEGSVLDAQQIAAGETYVRSISGTRAGSTSAAQLGGVGLFPDEVVNGSQLYLASPGGRTAGAYDIDGDGVDEQVSVFERADETAIVAWTEGDRCRVAFTTQGDSWYFDVACGTDGGLACRYGSQTLCRFSDGVDFSECTFEGLVVTCLEIEKEEPEVGPPDTGVEDVGVDVATDVEVIEEVGDDVEVDVEVDLPDAPLDTDDPEIDVPPVGECDPACMEASGATCCTECGCTCHPTCTAGYEWDCEVMCCFNYDLLECEPE
ncbi:MAG: hypothetical protein H6697_02570 [Myxococcales bacterium]|nr:hypothetical protein [Myxococcales bacterium]